MLDNKALFKYFWLNKILKMDVALDIVEAPTNAKILYHDQWIGQITRMDDLSALYYRVQLLNKTYSVKILLGEVGAVLMQESFIINRINEIFNHFNIFPFWRRYDNVSKDAFP